MGLEVGSVVASLGARLDDTGFTRFDRRLDAARRATTRPVEQELRADIDPRGFDRFGREVDTAERRATGRVEAKLGADVQRSGFATYDDLLDRADRRPPIETRAALDVDRQGFDQYERATESADRSTGRLRASMGSFAGVSLGVARGVGAVGVAAGAGAFGVMKLVGAYTESAKVGAQTNAVLTSTGHAANVTADEVGALATALSRKSGQDDEAIQSGLNLLLTFKGVKNEAGEGNDVFNQASETLLDMSTAMGGDASGSAIQLGKALNDPTKGITALTRVGVTFTDQQKEQIKTLQASGRTVDAQKIILRELNSEFGGSAAAQATNTDRMQVSLGNLAETIGGKLSPMVQRAAGYLDGLLNGGAESKAAPVIAKVKRTAGSVSDAVESIGRSRAFQTVERIAGRVGAAVADIGRRVGRAFSGVEDDLRPIGRALASLASTVARVYEAVAKRALPGIVSAFEGFARVVRGIIKVIAGLLSGDFGKAWDGIKAIARGALQGVTGIVRAGTAPFRAAVSAVFRGLSGIASSAWDGVTGVVRKGLDFLLGGVSSVQGAIASALDAAGKLPFIGGKFKGLADGVRDAQRSVDRYRESLRDKREEEGKTGNIEKQREAVGRLRSRLKTLDKGTEEYRDTAERLRSKQRALNKAVEDAEPAGRKGKKGVEQIGSGAKNAASTTTGAFTTIRNLVADAAKGLGVKAPTWNVGKAVSGAAKGDATATFAGGGWVGSRGQAGGDNVRTDVPAGSAVLNRHQQPMVELATMLAFGKTLDDRLALAAGGRVPVVVGNGERILDPGETAAAHAAMGAVFGVGLDDLFASVTRPHYAAVGGLMGANPGLAGYAQAGAKFGLRVSSGRRPGAITSSGNRSQHSTGDALDLSGAPSAMLSFARAFGAQHGPDVDQLIHTPLGYGWNHGSRVPLGFFGAQVNADHFDHVHLGDATPSGGATSGAGGADGAGSVAAPKITGPAGGLLSTIRGAGKFAAKAANEWLGKQAPAADTATGPVTGVAQGADANVVSAFRSAIASTSAPRTAALALWEAGIVESGLRNLQTMVDHDSLGALQLRVGMHGRDLALDPRGSAVAFLTRGFTGKGGAISLAERNYGTAGQIAQAVQGSAFPSRYDAVKAQAMRYLARGGMVQAFAGGGIAKAGAAVGKGAKKLGLRDRLDARYDSGTADLRSLTRPQTDRIANYDSLLVQVDDLGKDYGLQERRNDLTEETLVDEETGAVNTRDVTRRAGELAKLWSIRLKVQQRLKAARAVAARVIRTYTAAIGRLTRARAAARRSKSKSRKSAVASYTRAIAGYSESREEWRRKRVDVGYDLEDAKLDLRSLADERVEVLGTKAAPPPAADAGDTPDPADTPDTGEVAGGDLGSVESSTITAEASPADVAAAAFAQVGAFQAARADVFANFGANFTAAGQDPFSTVGAQAAGARYFGGSSSGTDGGTIAAAGGATVTQHITFTAPQQQDPHTATAAFLHELRAQVAV